MYKYILSYTTERGRARVVVRFLFGGFTAAVSRLEWNLAVCDFIVPELCPDLYHTVKHHETTTLFRPSRFGCWLTLSHQNWHSQGPNL